jgi:hypothetical protein
MKAIPFAICSINIKVKGTYWGGAHMDSEIKVIHIGCKYREQLFPLG